jgi:hypothetical protein
MNEPSTLLPKRWSALEGRRQWPTRLQVLSSLSLLLELLLQLLLLQLLLLLLLLLLLISILLNLRRCLALTGGLTTKACVTCRKWRKAINLSLIVTAMWSTFVESRRRTFCSELLEIGIPNRENYITY